MNVMAFFFALSGFLIVRIYYEQAELRRRWLAKYFVNRFARIYPVYFLLLSVAVCLHHDFRPWLLIKNYTLTHGLFAGTPFIIQPSWTLTVEECFYFLAPGFMILSRRHGFRATFALGCLLLIVALCISKLHIGFLQTPIFVLSTTFFGHFVEFFAGVYLALAMLQAEKQGRDESPGQICTLAGLGGVCVLAIAMVIVYRHPPLNLFAIVLINNFLIPAPIALLYWGLMREKTVLARFLSANFIGLLGRSSYSFYLLHTLVIDYVGVPFVLPATYRPFGVVCIFVATWLLSVLLFLFYEEPINILIRRKFISKNASIGLRAAA
jgi:peptidoglycan/LPS O-acetylase OafA/YrhL